MSSVAVSFNHGHAFLLILVADLLFTEPRFTYSEQHDRHEQHGGDRNQNKKVGSLQIEEIEMFLYNENHFVYLASPPLLTTN